MSAADAGAGTSEPSGRAAGGGDGEAAAAVGVAELAAQLAALPRAEQVERLRRVVPSLTLAERFALLHRLGIYRHEESASGAGSTLDETRRLRAALPALLRARGVRRLLDVPCGDFHWMSRVDLAGVEYVGGDVVAELVERNQALYGGPGRRFLVLDAAADALPPADLILCRDLLVHLSNDDVARVLRNFARGGARWLLTSHFPARDANPDILSGDFRPIHLCRSPFALPPPELVIGEESRLAGGGFADRSMALWPMAAVAASL